MLEQYGSAAMAGESNNGFPIWPLDGERMNEYFFKMKINEIYNLSQDKFNLN